MDELKANIQFKKVWADDDLVELEVRVSDGNSCFCNKVYVGHQEMKKIGQALDDFRPQVHGGVYDMNLGNFGPEYANGGFHARFHFHSGRLFVSTHQESNFFDFKTSQVANAAHLYMRTEPAALDEFVKSWKKLSSGSIQEAQLPCVFV